MDVGQLVLTMTFADFSNEVQNFLYLSREFDASHVGEGEERATPDVQNHDLYRIHHH